MTNCGQVIVTLSENWSDEVREHLNRVKLDSFSTSSFSILFVNIFTLRLCYCLLCLVSFIIAMANLRVSFFSQGVSLFLVSDCYLGFDQEYPLGRIADDGPSSEEKKIVPS